MPVRLAGTSKGLRFDMLNLSLPGGSGRRHHPSFKRLPERTG